MKISLQSISLHPRMKFGRARVCTLIALVIVMGVALYPLVEAHLHQKLPYFSSPVIVYDDILSVDSHSNIRLQDGMMIFGGLKSDQSSWATFRYAPYFLSFISSPLMNVSESSLFIKANFPSSIQEESARIAIHLNNELIFSEQVNARAKEGERNIFIPIDVELLRLNNLINVSVSAQTHWSISLVGADFCMPIDKVNLLSHLPLGNYILGFSFFILFTFFLLYLKKLLIWIQTS